MNFTLQDILGTCLAFFIFPSVFLFPGYVVSWTFDLFNFKQRRILTRYIIAIVVSVAVVPILVYLPSLLASFDVTKLIQAVFFILYVFIIVDELKKWIKDGMSLGVLSRYQKWAFFVAAGWVSFSIVSLVDLQWGNRLYNNVISLDFATRVTLVNAITRTGVPPVNPSFFPGHPEYITSLYYFWYILCSLIDQFGGNLVDSRMALIAGDAWCGLALMALIALYLRLRNHIAGDKAWKTAIIGIGLLAISGLDVIPVSINMLVTRLSYGFMWPAGDIEHWNEQITAWVGSLFWVPHHVAAMIACQAGLMLFQYTHQKTYYKKILVAIIAGLAFASAVGLSTWVAITFSIFWGAWILILLIQKKESRLVVLMMFAGFVALIVASPFLIGIIRGGTGASGLPFVVEVRRFHPVVPYVNWLSAIPENIIYFVLLPVNYLMELGFFLFIGLLWLRHYRNKKMFNNPFFIPEIILLCVVVFICSFVRSAIAANDLGWRGWLFGQFILLMWAVDIHGLNPFLPGYQGFINANLNPQKTKIKRFLTILMLIGFSTSVVDVALLRFWPILVDMEIAGFPNGLSPDTQLGQRTFAARLAHEFIRDELPFLVVVQQNPLTGIDRPSGLYGTRQIAISANAPYNVPLSLLDRNMDQISRIFILENAETWDKIDALCREYFIDVLVVNDLDPLWNSLLFLYQQRTALYENRYYAVLACGNFAFAGQYP